MTQASTTLPVYALTDGDAQVLMEVVAAPLGEARDAVLRRHCDERGVDATLALFGQFIALALSVTDNCRLQTELVLVADGGMHPHEAERINLPTIHGALRGVLLANAVDTSGTCSGCAFRLGTPANQSPSTTDDTGYCSEELKSFYCHQRGVMPNGALTRRCVGDAKIQRNRS